MASLELQQISENASQILTRSSSRRATSHSRSRSRSRQETPSHFTPADSTSSLHVHHSSSQVAETVQTPLPSSRAAIVIAQLAGVTFITSFTSGLLTVGLPAITRDLNLESELTVWPLSVYSLTSGTCFLIGGAIADVLGSRAVNLTGCFLVAVFILGCGLARTGLELVMFRACQGIASALVAPSSVALISTSVKTGKPRNIGFACLGTAMPLGFSFGLVLGGVLATGLGWRWGFYIVAGLGALFFAVGIWALPRAETRSVSMRSAMYRLATEIDWVGALLASAAIAILSYFMASLSADVDNIRHAGSIVMLCISVALMPAFGMWTKRQEAKGKPALIPNSLWDNRAFTSVCVMLLLANAALNGMELFSSLFFQEVQMTSALGASVRMLPNLLFGMLLNVVTGLVIDRISAKYAVLLSSAFCTGAPLLMANINPGWPYWYDAFFAQLLTPLSIDVLFTVGLLIVSATFPTKTQALAGAVFNTVAQVGTSIGLTVLAVISSTVTKEHIEGQSATRAIMSGYRASFWTLFAMMVTAVLVGAVGLRKLGRVGEKRD